MVHDAIAIAVPALLGAGLALLSRCQAGKKSREETYKTRVLKHFSPVPQLLEGKAEICNLELSRVYLMIDQNYPCWVVLVPRIDGIREITELTDSEQAQLWREVSLVSKAIQALYHPDKMNIAAIGNVVSQLHVHITARLASDPSWPGPCYGAVPAKEMSRIEVEQAVFTLQKAIKG